jgi:hypothetical protein
MSTSSLLSHPSGPVTFSYDSASSVILGSPQKKRHIFYFTVGILTERKCEIFLCLISARTLRNMRKRKKTPPHIINFSTGWK